jgi:hypothetical protein
MPSNSQEQSRTRRDLKAEFETTMDRFAMQGLQAEAIFGCIMPYRDFMMQNLAQAGQVPPSAFVSWMESADRDNLDLPDDLGEGLLKALDEILIVAVRDYQFQPREVVDALDEWVRESKEEFQEMHGVGGDFFDVE